MTNQRYILKRNHRTRKVGSRAWAKWFEKIEKRRVALDFVGKIQVSTIFVGLDHNFGRGRPVLFETMVFGGKKDGETNRYATWNSAVKGHKKIVASLHG